MRWLSMEGEWDDTGVCIMDVYERGALRSGMSLNLGGKTSIHDDICTVGLYSTGVLVPISDMEMDGYCPWRIGL
jgi:hypothetical protein